MDLTIVLYSMIGPFLVWPVEYFLPFPYVIEELFKTILLFFFPQKNFKAVVMSGIAFAVSETVFYTFLINSSGNVSLLFSRLLATSILHSVTFLVIYLSSKKNKWMTAVGFVLAVLIHYLYNRYIPIYL